jgi:DinB family protein/mycothiol maleylpyruvate isomerase-like protein
MTPLAATSPVDLRRASIGDARALDLRAAERDFWADEAATWDRFIATWAGLDDAAWHLPGAAPSDAGGPDWSLAEHIGHVADWQELAADYIPVALQTGQWPSDDDYDGGDFDRYNERRRAPWTTMSADAVVARLASARPRLLAAARRLPLATIRGDDAWGWVYFVLHGHYLDHMAVVEPWTDGLRLRQVDGDPFVADPRAPDHGVFRAQEAAIQAQFDDLVRTIPERRWTGEELTPGWTLRDHVGHLADWMDEGVRAVEVFHATGTWLADPEEGIDAWNERHVLATRDERPAATLARYDRARASLLGAVETLPIEDLRSPDGWSWVYDCLHGHVRKHLAMFGRWCAVADWPGA